MGGTRMGARGPIETLNDLFAALFKPGEGGGPIIRQPQRPLREDLFALFFPDALVRQFADKSKSNLTWFFNSDPRNKSVRRALVALLRQSPRATVDDVHRKCHQALWPRPGHAVFEAKALREALGGVGVPSALNGRWHITRPGDNGQPSRLDVFFEADEAGALARMLLTLATAGEAPSETVGEIWRGDAGGDCDFLGDDASTAGRIRYCRMLDLQGRHERAFQGFEAIARQLDRPAQSIDESTLYGRMGEMLFTGEGCARDEREALRFDELGLLEENPKSYYQLAKHTSGSPARQAMERAAELGYGPAIRELGAAWYGGSARLATQRNLETARRCFQRGVGMPGPDGAYCAYMLGQIYEAQGERAAAVNAYRIAQEGGSAEAAERLAGLDWMLEAAAPAEPSQRPEIGGATDYCLMNDLTGCNRLFLEELLSPRSRGDGRRRWRVVVCGDAPETSGTSGATGTSGTSGATGTSGTSGAAGASGATGATGASGSGLSVRAVAPERALRELAEGVYWGGAPRFPELVIALLSADWRQNLRHAVALLGELQRLARSLGDRAWDLVDQVSLYVMAEHDYAALLLDAAFAGMGELYFRVRVCDPALDAADRLFAEAPLFLPRLRAASDAPVALKVIGCGDAAMAVVRRAVALPMPEAAALTIDVYGESAGAMGRRFAQLCPGMAAAPELCGARPAFHDCAPEEMPLGDAKGLGGGNYYVIATPDDALNLRLAVRLRGALLRRDLEAERQPFIAVSMPQPVEGWLAASLPSGLDAPAGGRATAAGWAGQYELFPFGALTMYAPRALQSDPLERRARQAHMLFLGLPNTRDARHAAMGSYYRRQFNRDTARAAAQSLIYRLHQAGMSLPGWRLYGVPDEEAKLGPAYTRWLKEGENLRAATRDEHLRRNRMLLALGWSPATVEEVDRYVRRGNPGHLLYPARMDPFICPWEALESGELLRAVRDAVRARFPEKSVADPRRDEEASVRDTERLLDGM